MANITLLGASYSDVPAVQLPKTGGGTATFYEVEGSRSITENGTYDVTTDASVTVSVSGGGTSNLVQGSFATNSASGVQTITIPYTGSGYPICAMVFIKGGAYNPNDDGWYNTIQRYAVGQWTMHKAIQSSAPTYGTSGSANQAVTTAIYKNSTTSATSYTRTSGMNTNTFSSSNAANAAVTCVRFKNNTAMTVYIASTSYGLLADTEYEYHIIYSS